MKEPGIAVFVRRTRNERGITQAVLADAAGISRARVAQIEAGSVNLPNADHRRRLAKALGVSHLDVLIAAGELTPAEVVEAGAAGVVERDPQSLNARVLAAVEAVNWDAAPRMARVVLDIAQAQRSDQTDRSGEPTTRLDAIVQPLTSSEQGR